MATMKTAQVRSPNICDHVFSLGFTGDASILIETSFLFAAMMTDAIDMPRSHNVMKQKYIRIM